jgi:hypothetical protein
VCEKPTADVNTFLVSVGAMVQGDHQIATGDPGTQYSILLFISLVLLVIFF